MIVVTLFGPLVLAPCDACVKDQCGAFTLVRVQYFQLRAHVQLASIFLLIEKELPAIRAVRHRPGARKLPFFR